MPWGQALALVAGISHSPVVLRTRWRGGGAGRTYEGRTEVKPDQGWRLVVASGLPGVDPTVSVPGTQIQEWRVQLRPGYRAWLRTAANPRGLAEPIPIEFGHMSKLAPRAGTHSDG